ncbi:MAG TPA: PQQ-binding-like beta-propeller repeat protein, partial [Ktedonobacteraceae bacterium]|nr:PQQ-binding-like beta-propeller repeat protein [Ktedonobacteraceae bacterium]
NEAIYMWKDLTLLSLDDETGTIQWRNKQVAACDQQLNWVYPAGDIVLLSLERFDPGRESQVRGLQASDGRSLWQLSIGQSVLWTVPGQDTFNIVDDSRLTYKGVLVPVSITAYGIQDAQKRWQREEQASYLTVSRGMFYLINGPGSKNITALNGSDGSVRWSTRSDRTYTSLDIDDGTLYAMNRQGEVAVFSADDGREQWSYQNKNPNVIFVVANHNLYMRELSNGLVTGTLIALDANGNGPSWSWQAGSDAYGPLGNGYYSIMFITRLSCSTP